LCSGGKKERRSFRREGADTHGKVKGKVWSIAKETETEGEKWCHV